MSHWTYINGTITVSPMGRTQPEKRYILDTVLDHLPIVSGSETDMEVYVIQKRGCSSSVDCDEFGEVTNNLMNNYGQRDRDRGRLSVQDDYFLLVNAALRDRKFEQTYREFQKWICRLSKRTYVTDVLVEIKDYSHIAIIHNPDLTRRKSYDTVYGQMFEDPSWSKNKNADTEPNWCEYLMWDYAKSSSLPMLLMHKYFDDNENDKEVERRMQYGRSQYKCL